jgi:hypothetical protein
MDIFPRRLFCALAPIFLDGKSSESTNTPLKMLVGRASKAKASPYLGAFDNWPIMFKHPLLCSDIKMPRNKRQHLAIINIVCEHAMAPAKATDSRLLALPLELRLAILKVILKGWLVHHNIFSADADFEKPPNASNISQSAARKSFVSCFPVPCVPGPSKAVNQPGRKMHQPGFVWLGGPPTRINYAQGSAKLPRQSNSECEVLYHE